MRRERIKDYILSKSAVRVNELLEQFPGVSPMTIRRDLSALEELGFIIRTRGGARANSHAFGLSEDLYSRREIAAIEAKQVIAQKAAPFVEERRSIFFDSGTTVMALAKIMPDRDLTLFTTGPNIGLEIIMRTTRPQVTLFGGNLSRNTLSASGGHALDLVRSINIDIAFMAASAFSMAEGFTSGSPYECELKSAVVKKAKRVIMLMDTDKIEKNMPYTFARLEDINVLICESSPGKEIERAAAHCSVELL